ncbi:class I SAM-dependent methyltransferase [Rothia sp. ZJ1223]|uniref:class I SAM-dependent methyltransferase n=1 Tax=Rothia sp. ZJ1223 TaxID=2811098 RepID=UPI0019595179|nr:class I SAM-dependent methyltransferase [Rothia sp. ZJ1223]MBM7051178.1 SAM-dependent methyltransferase [Rothia sp. ZJ1223]
MAVGITVFATLYRTIIGVSALPHHLPIISADAIELSGEHQDLIASLVPYNADQTLHAVTSLRKAGIDAETSAFLLSQAKLRTKAQAKFGDLAHHLLLTDAGLEQATRAAVAAAHARRFAEAGIESVADLGCGIGADSLAFAREGLAVTAVELDAETAKITAHNLSGYPTAQVIQADITALNVESLTDTQGRAVQGLWLDPARREVEGGTTSKRVWDAEAFSPPLSFVRQLAARGIPMGVKMGPGIPHDQIPAECEAQWVTHAGSLVEVILWFNALARPEVGRAATALSDNPVTPRVLGEIVAHHDEAPADEVPLAPVGDFIYEPDAAVIRAGLVAPLAKALGAHLIDPNIAYLTTHHEVESPLVTGYRVRRTLPLHEKHLKKWVKEEGITTLTIKKRGVDIVPETLRSKLLAGVKKKKGAVKAATLIATRIGTGNNSQRFALYVEPLPFTAAPSHKAK